MYSPGHISGEKDVETFGEWYVKKDPKNSSQPLYYEKRDDNLEPLTSSDFPKGWGDVDSPSVGWPACGVCTKSRKIWWLAKMPSGEIVYSTQMSSSSSFFQSTPNNPFPVGRLVVTINTRGRKPQPDGTFLPADIRQGLKKKYLTKIKEGMALPELRRIMDSDCVSKEQQDVFLGVRDKRLKEEKEKERQKGATHNWVRHYDTTENKYCYYSMDDHIWQWNEPFGFVQDEELEKKVLCVLQLQYRWRMHVGIAVTSHVKSTGDTGHQKTKCKRCGEMVWVMKKCSVFKCPEPCNNYIRVRKQTEEEKKMEEERIQQIRNDRYAKQKEDAGEGEWIKYYDFTDGCEYYFNVVTLQCQWKKPEHFHRHKYADRVLTACCQLQFYFRMGRGKFKDSKLKVADVVGTDGKPGRRKKCRNCDTILMVPFGASMFKCVCGTVIRAKYLSDDEKKSWLHQVEMWEEKKANEIEIKKRMAMITGEGEDQYKGDGEYNYDKAKEGEEKKRKLEKNLEEIIQDQKKAFANEITDLLERLKSIKDRYKNDKRGIVDETKRFVFDTLDHDNMHWYGYVTEENASKIVNVVRKFLVKELRGKMEKEAIAELEKLCKAIGDAQPIITVEGDQKQLEQEERSRTARVRAAESRRKKKKERLERNVFESSDAHGFEAAVLRIFEAADVDNDGQLTQKEMKDLFTHKSYEFIQFQEWLKVTQGKIDSSDLFKWLDSDGSGYIEKDEFVFALTAEMKLRSLFIGLADENGEASGRVLAGKLKDRSFIAELRRRSGMDIVQCLKKNPSTKFDVKGLCRTFSKPISIEQRAALAEAEKLNDLERYLDDVVEDSGGISGFQLGKTKGHGHNDKYIKKDDQATIMDNYISKIVTEQSLEEDFAPDNVELKMDWIDVNVKGAFGLPKIDREGRRWTTLDLYAVLVVAPAKSDLDLQDKDGDNCVDVKELRKRAKGDRAKATSHRKNTMQPNWDETFSLRVDEPGEPMKDPALHVAVLDRNQVEGASHDEIVGSVVIPLSLKATLGKKESVILKSSLGPKEYDLKRIDNVYDLVDEEAGKITISWKRAVHHGVQQSELDAIIKNAVHEQFYVDEHGNEVQHLHVEHRIDPSCDSAFTLGDFIDFYGEKEGKEHFENAELAPETVAAYAARDAALVAHKCVASSMALMASIAAQASLTTAAWAVGKAKRVEAEIDGHLKVFKLLGDSQATFADKLKAQKLQLDIAIAKANDEANKRVEDMIATMQKRLDAEAIEREEAATRKYAVASVAAGLRRKLPKLRDKLLKKAMRKEAAIFIQCMYRRYRWGKAMQKLLDHSAQLKREAMEEARRKKLEEERQKRYALENPTLDQLIHSMASGGGRKYLPWEERLPHWLEAMDETKRNELKLAVANEVVEVREKSTKSNAHVNENFINSPGMRPFINIGKKYELKDNQIRELRHYLDGKSYVAETVAQLKLALSAVLDNESTGLEMLGRLQIELEKASQVFSLCREEDETVSENGLDYYGLKEIIQKAQITLEGLKELRPKTPPHKIRVTVVRAEKLINCDVERFGVDKSDPFCIVRKIEEVKEERLNNGDEIHRTQILQNSLDPIWNSEFYISIQSQEMGCVESDVGLSFEVWDSDDFTDQNLQGQNAVLPKSGLLPSENKTKEFLGWAYYQPFIERRRQGDDWTERLWLSSYKNFGKKRSNVDEAHGCLFLRFEVLGPTFEEHIVHDKAPSLHEFSISLKVRNLEPIQTEIKAICQDKARLEKLWRKIDNDNSGTITYRELEKYISNRWSSLSFPTAMRRAYAKTIVGFNKNEYSNSTTKQIDAESKDIHMIGSVSRGMFRALLRNLYFFSLAWIVFEKMEDADVNRSEDANSNSVIDDPDLIDILEFKKGFSLLNINMSDERAEEEFRICDLDGTGSITFDEFAIYLAEKLVPTPVDQKAVELEKLKQQAYERVAGVMSAKHKSVVHSQKLSIEELIDFDYNRTHERKEISKLAIEEWKGLYPKAQPMIPKKSVFDGKDDPYLVKPERPSTVFRKAATVQSAVIERKRKQIEEIRNRIGTRIGGRGERPGDAGFGGAIVGKLGNNATITVHNNKGKLRLPPAQHFTKASDLLLGGNLLEKEKRRKRRKERERLIRLEKIGKALGVGEGGILATKRRADAAKAAIEKQRKLDEAAKEKQMAAEKRRLDRLKEKRKRIIAKRNFVSPRGKVPSPRKDLKSNQKVDQAKPKERDLKNKKEKLAKVDDGKSNVDVDAKIDV
eukprot:g417.t1